jgi:hypothetical protein
MERDNISADGLRMPSPQLFAGLEIGLVVILQLPLQCRAYHDSVKHKRLVSS